MRVWIGACALFSSCFVFFDDREFVYVVDSLTIPVDDEDPEAGRDFDGDGEIDNNLPQFANAFLNVDLVLQDQLTDRINSGDLLFGVDLLQQSQRQGSLSVFAAQTQTGAPRFDGTDLLIATDEDTFTEVEFSDRLRVIGEGAQLLWPMFPFQTGEVLSLPLHDAQLDAAFDEAGMRGKLTGLMIAQEVGPLMEQVPALFDAQLTQDALDFGQGATVSCEGDDTCELVALGAFCSDGIIDNNASGLCVAGESASALIYGLMDNNSDGVFDVEFNEETGLFDANELTLLFSLDAQGNPGGLFGSQFELDLDADGIRESMPVGVRFTAVPATRAE
jgi:hypothetical protein